MNLSPLMLGIIILIAYICVFSLVDRICKCVEHCANAKSFAKTVASNKPDTETNNKGECL